MCPNFTSNVLGIYQQPCCKVQKYYLQNQETSLKKATNNPEKLRENKNSSASNVGRTEEPWDEMSSSGSDREKFDPCQTLSTYRMVLMSTALTYAIKT